MNLACVDFVEDLHEYERVEDDSVVLSGRGKHIVDISIAVWYIKPHWTAVQNDNQDNELVHTVSANKQQHSPGDQWLLPAIWLPLEEFVCWLFSSESKTSKRVHDEVDPEQLDGTKRCVADSERAEENKHYSNNIDCQLELEEFRDRVVDIATPLDSLDYAGKVVISENNI